MATTTYSFCLLWALFASFVAASSTIRNPLRALSTLQNATIDTHTHRVTALHNFDLSFILRPDLHVKLSLEPNHDLLPNSGLTVSYLNADGIVSRTEDVDRLAHKVFRGSAWYRQENVDDEWTRAGWARITIVRDGEQPLFQGAFSLNHDNHHIQLAPHFAHTRHHLDPHVDTDDQNSMVVYRDSDILLDQDVDYHMQELRRSLDYGFEDGLTCQSDDLGFNNQPDHPVYTAMLRRSDSVLGSETLGNLFGKRQVDSSTAGNSAGVDLSSTIGQTQGCPTTRRVALVGVATDCTYTGQFNSSESVRMNVIDQMNTASSIYETTFNISLGLANLTISDANCPGTPNSASAWNQACSDAVDIQDRLNLFSAWRGNQQDSNSHWTLLSTCNTGSAVGLAWLGQACVQTAYSTNSSTTGNGQSSTAGSETVTGANVVIRTRGASEWQIIAHETGHTFGAVHDCTADTCASTTTVGSQQCCPLSANTCNAGEAYIMNPSTSSGVKNFSPCSVGNICSALGRNSVRSTCLTENRNIKTISAQECGNGIVEDGEDCDCGGEAGCAGNSCCDAATCKFRDTAVCDDSNEGCCNNCQFASNGTVCRASTGACDPAETCSGTSGTCPQDASAPDGDSCGNRLQCASGQCTSRDQQCRSVMGGYQGVGNNTSACDSSSCQIRCSSGRSSAFGNNVCFEVQQNFLDGTPCGGGGKCDNGRCRGTNTGGEIRSWIDDHKGIVIGVCVGVGGLLLLSIMGCCIRACRRRRVKPAKMQAPPPGWGTQMRPMPQNPSYPPPPQQYGQGGYGQQWAPPQGPPPPAYTPGSRYA
ncbi:zincin [Aureobasidium pullulans]|nr:zincin [Aureobasidium pullulans]